MINRILLYSLYIVLCIIRLSFFNMRLSWRILQHPVFGMSRIVDEHRRDGLIEETLIDRLRYLRNGDWRVSVMTVRRFFNFRSGVHRDKSGAPLTNVRAIVPKCLIDFIDNDVSIRILRRRAFQLLASASRMLHRRDGSLIALFHDSSKCDKCLNVLFALFHHEAWKR